MSATATGSNYIVVSGDTHAGADVYDYKEYLDRRWHDEFDAWAAAFVDPWERFQPEGLSEWVGEAGTHPNWDSDVRVKALEADGIAAEIIYPNTIPPFFPFMGIQIPMPRTQHEYEQRWAGLQAHNRWQVDFCSLAPGRRKGLAQVFLNDVDDAVSEARWAKENGFAGLLLPAVPPNHPGARGIWNEEFDPLWSVCEELQLPINQHAGSGSPDFDIEQPADRAILLYEIQFFSHRTLWHLILGGVLERHPGLRVVFTEQGAANWIPRTLGSLDAIVQSFRMSNSGAESFGGELAAQLSLLPSEYFQRQCAAATFLTPSDVGARHALGVDNLLWGSDYPHQESTVPNSRAAMRVALAGVPEHETRRMLGMNAVELYGFDELLLADVARSIGPSPEEVNVKFDPSTEGVPENFGSCPAFFPDDQDIFA
jgi:predicted TIM-barrel fold metal-dependent hydrolase